MSASVTIAVVYHSSSGRTRALAESVARGAASIEGAVASTIRVEDASRSQAALAAADAIVFGAPTYMGSVSAPFKAFMDATSAIWALQGWRDKLAAGFTHSAAPSGDKLGTLIQLAVFAAQHGMVWVGLGLPPTYAGLEPDVGDTNRLGSHLGAMAQSRPGGGTVPESDLRTAEHLGRRVAEAALRWSPGRAPLASVDKEAAPAGPPRHHAARGWSFPPAVRPPPPPGIARTNLKEIVAGPGRFEHHLVVCATVDGVQLEVATASEPLYFAHINLSDEYAVALWTGDDLVDRFPLRTFLTDPRTNEDVGRYNHRVGDLVLHPEGLMHWPGRLRPPYEPFDFPPGMRRCGLSLVYCASKPTPPTWCPTPAPKGREGDAKAYRTPAPPMVLASLRSQPGVVAQVGRTELMLVELPDAIAPPRGGWVIVLEAEAAGPHAPCDLLRVPAGASLDGRGITRALVLASSAAPPDPPPPSWTELPPPPLAPYEDGPSAELPFESHGLRVEALSPSVAVVALDGSAVTAETPRYWLARMLFRVALHGMRLGYVETYGRVFVDDRGDDVVVGVHGEAGPVSVAVPRAEALGFIERLYRSVAPEGYTERLV